MPMIRRRFLEGCAGGLAGLLAASTGSQSVRAALFGQPREIAADLVIIGGGVGGCAAALCCTQEWAERGLDRAHRLDRRSAHVSGCPARRAPLDRAVRPQRGTTPCGRAFVIIIGDIIPSPHRPRPMSSSTRAGVAFPGSATNPRQRWRS